ncbi:MAG: hypothetical protein K0R84_1020, partial [Clostridia bacterium]|nr:hypothetical protein [Clostridia bacterium]
IFVPISVMTFYHISQKLKDNKLLMYLGGKSFYIYLLHEPFMLSIISRNLLRHGLYRYGVLVPIIAIVSVVLSILVYACLIRIPVVRTIFRTESKAKGVAL